MDNAAIEQLWRGLESVGDPCHVLSGHGLSIVDIGIVNRVEQIGDTIEVGMTFTEAGCTFAYGIIESIEDLLPTLPGIRRITVVPEHYPLWTPDRLSDKARRLFSDKNRAFGVARHSAATTPIQGASI